MMFDTDVLIWFFRGDRTAAAFLESSIDRSVSIISLMELMQGARNGKEVRSIRQFLLNNQFRLIPVNESISHLAANLIEEHAMRDGLQVADALIAATARETGATLATGNVHHFRAIARLEVKAFRPASGRLPTSS